MKVTRRDFVKKTAVAAASVGAAASLGAGATFGAPAIWTGFSGMPSDQLRFGAIGINGMGGGNVGSFLKQENLVCAALCDVDAGVLEKRAVQFGERQGARPDTYEDYRTLLERKDLDFVMIGTPDHWHCLQAVHAMESGKHVYVEKPLSNSIGECDIMLAAARHHGKLVQMGQWQRSGPHWRNAVDFVHSGALGNIRTVKAWAYQGWMKPVPIYPDEAVPAGVNYDMWLGPMPLRPFNKNRFHFNFRWFWDYAGGLMTDWGVHIIDYALYGMNAPYPTSVMASGGKFAYPDDASETPDTLQAVFEFDGFTMLWEHATGIDLGPYGKNHGVAFIGNNGTLVVNRAGWEVIAEDDQNKPLMEVPAPEKQNGNDLDRHTVNFVNAIRSGEALHAPVEVGHKAAVVAHMGNVAFKTGRKVYWDQSIRQFKGDEEANTIIKPTYRAPWTVPNYSL